MAPSPDSTLAQLRRLRADLPPATPENVDLREDLLLEARALMQSLERPDNVVERVCYQILETIAIRIAVNLGVLKILSEQAEPQFLEDLAVATKADPVLLERLLRCLASFGAVQQHSPNSFSANNVSSTFANPKGQAHLEFCLDFLTRGWLALPAYLKQHSYQNPSSSTNTALAQAYNRESATIWDIVQNTPYVAAMHVVMSTYNAGHKEWFDIYPVDERLAKDADSKPGAVFMVDVGGGHGNQALTLKQKFPNLPGRFVVQDVMPAIPAEVPEHVKFTVHDFMTEQPIKGARLYYLRYVPHDWPQDVNVQILTQLRQAMKPGYSRLIINEWIVPAQGASKFMTAQDLNMMTVGGGMERTETWHREYIERAGLKVTGIWSPDDRISESVIEAEVV